MKSSQILKVASTYSHTSDSVGFELMYHMAPNEIQPDLEPESAGSPRFWSCC